MTKSERSTMDKLLGELHCAQLAYLDLYSSTGFKSANPKYSDIFKARNEMQKCRENLTNYMNAITEK